VGKCTTSESTAPKPAAGNTTELLANSLPTPSETTRMCVEINKIPDNHIVGYRHTEAAEQQRTAKKLQALFSDPERFKSVVAQADQSGVDFLTFISTMST